MKTLQEIQKENRKMILEAIYGCNYEEVLKKEFNSYDCQAIWQTNYGQLKLQGDPKYLGYNRERHHPDCFLVEIIGRPITLNRVLLAIIKSGKCMDSKENLHKIRNLVLENWDLELEALEQQIEEKQIEINQLLKGE